MAEVILVKIAPLGRPVTEVMIPQNSTVDAALKEAVKVGVRVDGYDDLRKNGKPVTRSDIVNASDIITLIPSVRGGF
jgi:hypothetical protein